MITLYDVAISGNCYKVRLLLSLLQLDYQRVPVDLKQRQQKSAEFLAINPLGQVPVLVDGDKVIRDSQAILVYLARAYGGSLWWPDKADEMAEVMQWLSNAANEIAHGFAAARAYYLLNRLEIDIQRAQDRATALLLVLNAHLAEHDWLALKRPTIADVACYPYIALAEQGKIDLAPYPYVVAWLARVQQLPHYAPML